MDEDALEIGVAIDAVDGGSRPIEDHGDVHDGDLPGTRVIAAVDKETLVFVSKVVAEDAFDAVTFLFEDEFGEVVVVDAGHFYIGVAVPATGDGLGG